MQKAATNWNRLQKVKKHFRFTKRYSMCISRLPCRFRICCLIPLSFGAAYFITACLLPLWCAGSAHRERAARPTRILRDKNLRNARSSCWSRTCSWSACQAIPPTDSTDHCTQISRRAMLFKSHGTILVILQVRFSPWIRSRPGKILLALLTCICWWPHRAFNMIASVDTPFKTQRRTLERLLTGI